jgi:dTMP kinase
VYIVIEGQDGTGKTTQVNLLAEYFRGLGREVLILNEGAREDSGLLATDQIDAVIKTRDFNLDPLTNVMLFTAQRRELWTKLAEPMLARNGIVISSRNWWSTLAYQHYGQGVKRDVIERITRMTMPERYVKPDLGVILVLDDDERRKRTTSRDDKHLSDTFESQANEFQKRVNDGYLEIAEGLEIPVIDASGTIDKIHESITKQLRSVV